MRVIKLPSVGKGAWVKVPYNNDIGSVYLRFGDSGEWLPSFYEAGQIMVRCPDLEPGSYTVWLSDAGTIHRAATVRIE